MKEKRFIDILPKIENWEVVEYSSSLNCPTCNKSGFWTIIGQDVPDKPKLIGWCETSQGFMMVFECPDCFSQYRFHGNGADVFDMDAFDFYIKTHYVNEVSNGNELKKKFEEYCKAK